LAIKFIQKFDRVRPSEGVKIDSGVEKNFLAN